VISLQGFLIVDIIIGGQTLASASERINPTIGVVIVSAISLVMTFLGYRIIHLYVSLVHLFR